jgi:hypothetical protein
MTSRSLRTVVVVIAIALFCSNHFVVESHTSIEKTSALLNEQLNADKAVIEKIAPSECKFVFGMSSSPSAIRISVDFPDHWSLEKRQEYIGTILTALSAGRSSTSGRSLSLEGSRISLAEHYGVFSASFLTYKSPSFFQGTTLWPLLAFLYEGPTPHYRIRVVGFSIGINGLAVIAKLPHDDARSNYGLVGTTFATRDTYDNIETAPSCIIYDCAPIELYPLQLFSVKLNANMFVSPGSAGIIRSIGDGLIVSKPIS